MAIIWGTLGQQNPPASTLTTAYTVPAGKHAAVQIVVANVGGVVATVRVAISPLGAAVANKHYVLYDYNLAVGGSQSTAKVVLAATDVIRIFASTANVAFNINGIEEDD